MSGSAIWRSTRRAAAATRAVRSAAGPRNRSHWRTVDTLDRCALDLERRSRLLQVDDQRPLAAVTLPELGDAAVPDQRAVVDHEQPVAEPLDVAEVVRRQEHRHAALTVDLDEEVAHAL